MLRNFVLGPNAATLERRLFWIILLRALWLGNRYSQYPTAVLIDAITPFPQTGLWQTQMSVWLPDVILAVLQAGIVFGLIRFSVISRYPSASVRLGLVQASELDEARKASQISSWQTTAALMTGLVVVTCCLIGWAIASTQYPGIGFYPYVYNLGGPAVLTGFGLSALGCLFGNQYVTRAAGQISSSFRITLLSPDHPLYLRVGRLAAKLDMPSPQVGVTDVTNAFAMGSTEKDALVVIGTPLLKLGDDELDAIIGHELGHILAKDIRRMQFAEGFQRMLAMVTTFGTTVLAAMAAQLGKNRREAALNSMVTRGIGGLIRQTVFIGSELVVKGISRNREFYADAVGARVTSGDAMIRALKRIHGVEVKPTAQEQQYGYLMFRSGKLGRLFSTHPSLEARVRSLQGGTTVHGTNAPLLSDRESHSAANSALGMMSDTAPDTPSPRPQAEEQPQNRGAGLESRAAAAGRFVRHQRRRLVAFLGIIALLLFVFPAIDSYYGISRKATEASVFVAELGTSYWQRIAASSSQAVSEDGSVAGLKAEMERLKIKIATAPTLQEMAALATEKYDLKQQVESQKRIILGFQQSEASFREQIRQMQDRISASNSRAAAPAFSRRPNQPAPEELLQAERSIERLKQQNLDLQAQLSAKGQELDDWMRSGSQGADKVRELQQKLIDKAALEQQVASQKSIIMSLTMENATAATKIRQLEQAAANQSSAVTTAMVATPSSPGYGALASARNGIVYLTPQRHANEADAGASALAGCRSYAGNSPCQLRKVYAGTCAAVARVEPATRQQNWQLGLGDSIDAAETNALTDCTQRNGLNCRITVPAACTF